jgi:hypothetical protein
MFGGAAQQYRRIGDDAMFTVDDQSKLPCEGTAACSFEPLPQGGDYVTVYPRGYVAPATQPAPTQAQTIATRSVRDVLLEAVALGMMGGGAVAFGYGLGKERTAWAVGGLLLVVAGAGLRLSVLIPWFTRARDALLAPGMVSS